MTTQTVSMGRVLIVGGNYDYIRLFKHLGFTGTYDINDADIVVFTGGEDVSPDLYGEMKLQLTHSNRERDDFEVKVFERAKALGLPMVGICRGSQFLNVMNEGTLWQDVNNHGRNHVIHVNKEVCPWFKQPTHMINSGGDAWVTSTHHQMMRPGPGAQIVATAKESTERHAAGVMSQGKADANNPDIEVVWYPATNALCFQPHPEFTHAPPTCKEFFAKCIDNFILEAMPLPEQLREVLNRKVNK